MPTTVNNISNQHLAYADFQSCWITNSLASGDSTTTSTIPPGESAGLLHPKYKIGAIAGSPESANNAIKPESTSTSTSRDTDDEGVEVINSGSKTLVFISSDEDEDDIVLEPGESATLEGDEYDIDIEDIEDCDGVTL